MTAMQPAVQTPASAPAVRLPDWPARLAAMVAAAHPRPFAWGVHDCCLWAADAVLATTGHDPAADLRGQYSTAGAGQRALQRLGGLRGVGGRAGPVLASPGLAWDGDIGLVSTGQRPMLAVRVASVWLCTATHGLHALPAAAARWVWGVGHA